MIHYLALSGLQVQEASVHAGFYSAGAPAMTALAGFTHALELKLNQLVAASEPSDDELFSFDSEPLTIKVTGFIPVFDEFRLAPGAAKRINYEHGAKKGEAASAAFDPIADLTLTLILRVESDANVDELKGLLSKKRLCAAVLGMRLSGGSIFWDTAYALYASVKEALDNCSSTSMLIEEATELLTATMAKGYNVVDALDLLTSRPEKDSSDDKGKTPDYEPRHIALALGFRALESSPQVRAGSKGACLHQFVEPVLGLGRVRLVASARKALAKKQLPLLWRYTPPLNGYYLVRADYATPQA